jgi:hypothetical protein
MCIQPGMSKKLGRRIISKKEMKLIKEKNRLVMIVQNIAGGSSDIKVIPFKNKKAEELFVLEKEQENVIQADRSFLYIYLQFGTRTITSCLHGDKKIKLEDKTVYEAPYIFDGQHRPGSNEIHIVPASELPKLVNLSTWTASFREKVNKNPKKMCLLYYGKSNVIWLDRGYTKVSELKTAKRD